MKSKLTDAMAEQLLELIYVSVTEYGETTKDITLSEYVADIAMSMDVTSDRADELRRMIEENLCS